MSVIHQACWAVLASILLLLGQAPHSLAFLPAHPARLRSVGAPCLSLPPHAPPARAFFVGSVRCSSTFERGPQHRRGEGSIVEGLSNIRRSVSPEVPRGLLSPKQRLYVKMMRPHTIPWAMLLVFWGALSAGAGAVRQPCVWLTAVCVALILSTSMIVNDYYDFRTGTDLVNQQQGRDKGPLARGAVEPADVKGFLTWLYGGLLFLVCLVDVASLRILLMAGSVATFLYTKVLKPVPFVKNVTCAAIISMTLSAGRAAMSGVALPGGACAVVSAAKDLWAPTLCLFIGILQREMMMDVVDCEGDRAAGINTLPVICGRNFTLRASVACLAALTLIGTLVPLFDIVARSAGGGFATPAVRALLLSSNVLRPMAAFLSLFTMWKWMITCLRAEGSDVETVNEAVTRVVPWAFVLTAAVMPF